MAKEIVAQLNMREYTQNLYKIWSSLHTLTPTWSEIFWAMTIAEALKPF